MSSPLKNDIRTIIEVSIFIVLYFAIESILDNHSVLDNAVTFIAFGIFIYRRFILRNSSNLFLIPTANDKYSGLTLFSFGILVIALSAIAYIMTKNPKTFLMVLLGLALIFFSRKLNPGGWIRLNNNSLKFSGIKGTFDIRTIKEIILENNRITITNTWNESFYGFNFRLTCENAIKLRAFLENKLSPKGALIINKVTTINTN